MSKLDLDPQEQAVWTEHRYNVKSLIGELLRLRNAEHQRTNAAAMKDAVQRLAVELNAPLRAAQQREDAAVRERQRIAAMEEYAERRAFELNAPLRAAQQRKAASDASNQHRLEAIEQEGTPSLTTSDNTKQQP